MTLPACDNNIGHNGNQYLQDFTIFVPFNRPFELQFDYNLIVSNKGGSNNTYHGNTGGTPLPGFQLSESKISASCSKWVFACPPRRDNGNGVSSLAPQYQF